MSRHRGAKHRRRYELLGGISLPPDVRPGLANLRAPPLLFRRRPPQSNYPPDTVRNPDYGSTLEHQTLKGGISRSAPCRLASTLLSLPPILHIKAQCSVSSYSKGSRGLSVLPRVHCIFTASSISLSLGWRQPGHHYAIRLPGLRSRASLALTPSINLPAPGRRHTVYVHFRVCTVLCF